MKKNMIPISIETSIEHEKEKFYNVLESPELIIKVLSQTSKLGFLS
jgi:hypothetical protein